MNWSDPNPAPIIEQHNGIYVVNDAHLGVGSKVRFIDHLIQSLPQKEIVFGSCPAVGYAQVSLPYVCNKYGKKAILFMAKRAMDKLTPYQKQGIELGAEYHWVPDGMLPVTQKRACDYVREDTKNRFLFPIGLEHPSVIESIVKVARNLPIVPHYFFTVGSSGTLNRGLQAAWPNANALVIQVGHNMKDHEIGRAILIKSPYAFDRKTPKTERPPFESNPYYDAKGWWPMLHWIETFKLEDKKVLFWNVA